MDKPLAGLKVLELARILAGPWVGQIAGRSRRRCGEGRASRRGRRHARVGPALHRGSGWRRSLGCLFPLLQPRQAFDRGRFRDAGRPGLIRELALHADVVIENFKVGGLEEIRPRLREPEGGQSAARLLLDHRFRPGRALCLTRRLRLHDPGHGRHHGSDRRSRGRAAEDRRGLRGHFHRRLFGRRHPGRACGDATRRAGARISTWRCSMFRPASSPIRP